MFIGIRKVSIVCEIHVADTLIGGITWLQSSEDLTKSYFVKRISRLLLLVVSSSVDLAGIIIKDDSITFDLIFLLCGFYRDSFISIRRIVL